MRIKKNASDHILRTIRDWEQFFSDHASYFSTHVAVCAQGGTLDAITNEKNKLIPSPHPITINRTRGLSASNIARLFTKHSVGMATLGDLYAWSQTHGKHISIPWKNLKLARAVRISSFDSGQEQSPHFIASLSYAVDQLSSVDALVITQGTDSLVNKAALFAVTLSPYLYAAKKKVIFVGSSESGYVENSLAISNITGSLYAVAEAVLPGGVYIVTNSRNASGEVIHILPGLGSVKLHADGLFYAPNTGSILRIEKGRVFKTRLSEDLHQRVKNLGLFPYLAKFYFKDSAINRLERALENVSIESVDNDPDMLHMHYQKGKRIFLIRARGAGTAPEVWKEAVQKLTKRQDVTIMVITQADRGDVNLVKYAAGLDIPGVLSGRTLREESALVFAAIAHDLRLHEGYSLDDLQQLIERYCYLAGMVSLGN
ncbi:MAG: asparaginase domain-containing protein [Patescibacteria group bacterium]